MTGRKTCSHPAESMRRGAGGRCLDCRADDNKRRRGAAEYQTRERERIAALRSDPEYRAAERKANNARQNALYAVDEAYREDRKRRAREGKARLLSDEEKREQYLREQVEYRRRVRALPEVRERRREYNRQWRQQNSGRRAARQRHRACRKSCQTPPWLTPEQRLEMLTFYEKAKQLSTTTGEPYHVDHIVPLRGRAVSGLHVPWNLQVLPALENIRKGNRL